MRRAKRLSIFRAMSGTANPPCRAGIGSVGFKEGGKPAVLAGGYAICCGTSPVRRDAGAFHLVIPVHARAHGQAGQLEDVILATPQYTMAVMMPLAWTRSWPGLTCAGNGTQQARLARHGPFNQRPGDGGGESGTGIAKEAARPRALWGSQQPAARCPGTPWRRRV